MQSQNNRNYCHYELDDYRKCLDSNKKIIKGSFNMKAYNGVWVANFNNNSISFEKPDKDKCIVEYYKYKKCVKNAISY